MESHFTSNNNDNSTNGDRHSFDKDDEYNSAKTYFLNIVNSIIVAEGELLPRSLRTRNLEADFDQLWSQYILIKEKKISLTGISPEIDQNKENGKILSTLSLPFILPQPHNESATESVSRRPFHCSNNNTK
uniref:Uncharacterized protein n=1 Tax=Strongyloides papillosus TaxID=174720 RepID=A0A0N5BCN3_STREA